jgi:short-subunit dehydrogenase
MSQTVGSTKPVALVTGAASGIGLAAVRRLVERGYCVAAIDMNVSLLDDLAAQHPGAVKTFVVDVTDFDQVDTAVSQVEEQLGSIEHVFASAGIARVGETLSVSRRDVDLMMAVNYGGVVNLAYTALARMTGRRRGEFVVIASLTGLVPPRKMAAYGATKAAVIGFMGSLRYDVETSGVKLACVCPEQVATPMASDFFADAGNRAKASKMAITPEKVVSAAEKGLRRGRFLVLPGVLSKGAAMGQRLAPSLLRRAFKVDRLDFV